MRGVCGVAQSGKSGDLTKIGQFGIGFKSVYAYTRTPAVHSGAEHFRIDHYVRPAAVDPAGADPADTLFVFPFDHETVTAGTAVAEISAALNRTEPAILLFLRNVTRLRAHGTGVTDVIIEKRARPRAPVSPGPGGRHVTLTRGTRRAEHWLVWDRPLDGLGHAGQRVELAFRAGTADGEPRLTAQDGAPLVVFFPTEKETFLGFLIQGPYRTTPARDNVPGDDPENQALVRETAVLLTGVLRDLRASGLLTVEVLAALPLDAGRFPPGSMLRPLFDAVRAALTEEELIPAAGGGFAAARNLKLASSAGLGELLDPGQLGALFQADVPLAFAQLPRTKTRPPGCVTTCARRSASVRSPPGICWPGPRAASCRPSPTNGSRASTGSCTPIPRCGGSRGRRATRRARPAPGRSSGWKMAARPSLSTPPGAPRPTCRRTTSRAGGDGFPTVRRAVAEVPAARAFLEALKFTEPDIVAEVLEVILPRYARLAERGAGPDDAGTAGEGQAGVAALDRAQHACDLDCVMRAMDEADAGRRPELLGSCARPPS